MRALRRIAELPPGPWPARALCLPVVLLALLDLVGWYARVPWLTRPLMGAQAMKPNTALSLLLLSFAVLALPWGRRTRAAAVAAMTVVGVLAVGWLMEPLAGVSLGLDDLWPGLSFPGTSGLPSPFTAVGLVLVVVELHGARWRWHRTSETAGVTALVLAYLAIVGYLLGAPHLYQVRGYSTMAFATAVSLCLLALAGLTLDRTRGLVGLLADPGSAGRLVRVFLPFLVAGPIALGWLRLRGQSAGWYDTTFGAAISTVALTVVGLALLVLTGGRVQRAELARDRVDAELHSLNAELEARVVERTAALAEAQAHAEHLALHDGLTELPNRLLIMDRLEQALQQAERHGGAVGVLFLDLDDFKPINDTYGHQAGDEVLRQVGQRLRHAIRGSDTVGRLGGDEFVVVCPEVHTECDLENVTRAIVDSLAVPVLLGDGHVHVRASVGRALGHAHDDPERLLIRADNEMYRAKARTREQPVPGPRRG